MQRQAQWAAVAVVAVGNFSLGRWEMKTYPSVDEGTGLTFAFEIDNIYVSNSVVASILSTVDGVHEIRTRRLFSKWEEIHVWFKYMDRDYIVWEPYGDNSRYWIGPKDKKEPLMDIKNILAAFERYSPPLPIKLLGDILSLNFKSLFRHSSGP